MSPLKFVGHAKADDGEDLVAALKIRAGYARPDLLQALVAALI